MPPSLQGHQKNDDDSGQVMNAEKNTALQELKDLSDAANLVESPRFLHFQRGSSTLLSQNPSGDEGLHRC